MSKASVKKRHLHTEERQGYRYANTMVSWTYGKGQKDDGGQYQAY